IQEVEGAAPQGISIPELMAGRDWLFEGMNYYVDTSHLVSVLGFSLESTDPAMLRMAIELCEYGEKLSPMFHYRGDPPFENIYVDHRIFLKALLGEDVDAAVSHFVKKVEDSDPEEIGTGPAQILVVLLTRLKRYAQAVEISLRYLSDTDQNQLACPSVLQLCYLSGDTDKLKEIAKKKQDLLGFAAGLLA
ncbi:MAG: hypothetical protein ABI822_32005, partial [Bryobacteraceae bacterium]